MEPNDPTPFKTRSKLLTVYAAQTQSIRDGGDPFPVALEVNICNSCNQGCHWCITGDVRDGADVKSELDVHAPGVRRFFEDFKRLGGRCIGWSGGGEPTYHHHFEDALKLISEVGLPQGLITHGAFREELIDPIARYCEWTRISIDTHNPSTYKERRRASKQSFDLVQHNARTLAERGATVGLNMNVANWNQADIEPLYELACELGVTYFQVRPTLNTPFPTGEESDFLTPSSIPSILKRLDRLLQRIDPRTDLIVSHDKFHDLQQEDVKRTYVGCKSHRLFVVLNFNGELVVCMYHLPDERFVFGNVYTQPLEEIWRSQSRQRVLDFCERRTRRGLDHKRHACQVCCKGHEINKVLYDGQLTLNSDIDMHGSPFI